MRADIKAKLFFYHDGKSKPRLFHSGYRPAFKIRDDEFSSGQIEFIGMDSIEAGRNADANIIFLHPERVKDYLAAGNKFVFYEGDFAKGEAEIIEINL